MRTCPSCTQSKDNSEFHAKASWCKLCTKEALRLSRARRFNEPGFIAQRLFHNAKSRSTNVTITQEWILDRLSAGHCEVTGIPFEYQPGKGRGATAAFGPSLDQLVPGAGYTPENTQVVCWIYNRAKGCDNHAAVLKLMEALRGKEGN